jgi:hypothetical protein
MVRLRTKATEFVFYSHNECTVYTIAHSVVYNQ